MKATPSRRLPLETRFIHFLHDLIGFNDSVGSRLELPICAPSLGCVETLITRPVQTSHSSLSPEEREAAGISDSLIRVAVGIESAEDLCADFEQALSR